MSLLKSLIDAHPVSITCSRCGAHFEVPLEKARGDALEPCTKCAHAIVLGTSDIMDHVRLIEKALQRMHAQLGNTGIFAQVDPSGADGEDPSDT